MERTVNAEITIRQANEIDTNGLFDLNNKFQFHLDRKVEQQKTGFLLNAPLSKADFSRIIKNEEIVVACCGDRVVGYFLVDTCSDTPNLVHSKQELKTLISLHVIPGHLKIAPRAQVVIDADFQKSGIYKQLIGSLASLIRGKFDGILGIVAKNNPKLMAHEKVGWTVVKEDNDWFYVLYHLSA